MRFQQTDIAGVVVVEPDLLVDERGFFTRLACVEEFRGAGVEFEPRQTSLSRNVARHTLRGMHYCAEPEAKLVRCARGRVFDVVFDIRRESPTFGATAGFDIDAVSARGLYIPPGVAHGFLTLEPDCDVLYQIDRTYQSGHDFGLRWDDPFFNFAWPATPALVGARDAAYPDFSPQRAP